MKYTLRVLTVHDPQLRTFDDLEEAVAAACDCIERPGAFPEEILGDDGTVVMNVDMIGQAWCARCGGEPQVRRARG